MRKMIGSLVVVLNTMSCAALCHDHAVAKDATTSRPPDECHPSIKYVKRGGWHADGSFNEGEPAMAADKVPLAELLTVLNDPRNRWPRGSRRREMKFATPLKISGLSDFGADDPPQIQVDDYGVKVFFFPTHWRVSRVETNICGRTQFVLSGNIEMMSF